MNFDTFNSPSGSRHEPCGEFSETSDWHLCLHSISLRLSEEISLSKIFWSESNVNRYLGAFNVTPRLGWCSVLSLQFLTTKNLPDLRQFSSLLSMNWDGLQFLVRGGENSLKSGRFWLQETEAPEFVVIEIVFWWLQKQEESQNFHRPGLWWLKILMRICRESFWALQRWIGHDRW
jgi:hypothetical protein